MPNALSVDLEDWYHSELIRKYAHGQKQSCVKVPTEILLGLLSKYNVKATFFVLGEVARDNPELISKIYREGHEIAFHGFSHKPLYEIGPQGLRSEWLEFKRVISGIIGEVAIKGFRAPTFSLNQNTAWAVDILKEFNFKYDSSIFPVKVGLYGMSAAPINIYGLNGNDIKTPDARSALKEFPLTVFELRPLRFPVSGGFYMRAMPIYLQIKFLELISKKRAFVIYLHPWECDLNIPRLKLNAVSSFISYYNIKSTFIKLEKILSNFPFDRIDNILGV